MKEKILARWWIAAAVLTLVVAGLYVGTSADAAGKRGPFAKVPITGTTENDVLTFNSRVRGVACYIWAPQAGTVKTYYNNPDGVRREMDSRAVSATTLLVIDFDYRLPEGIMTYTASVDPTGSNIEVECGTY